MSYSAQLPDLSWHPVVMAGTQWRDFSANGSTYRISVALPEGPAPEQGFPVMYLLDANASFATVVETHRRLGLRPDATGVDKAVIVGIGHPGENLYDMKVRERDYLPQALHSGQTGNRSGGAEAFLDFIETELKPSLQTLLPLDLKRQNLAGHSLSAYFTLWVMARHGRAFQNYIAVSPSLWTDMSLAADIPAITAPITRLFIAAGQWEEALAPWQLGEPNAEEIAQRRTQRRMIGNARAFADGMAAHIGADRVQFSVFPDEDHASVFTIAMGRAMRSLFRRNDGNHSTLQYKS